MSILELMTVDWLGRGWLLILAFTAAVLVVIALRKPCRRLFGAERAFQLWSLVPLAMLASQLPHAADANGAKFPALVYMITSVGGTLPSHADASLAIGWRSVAMLAWCAGIVMALASAVFAQWRYRRRLRGATSVTNASSRWPVLRATSADVGPALVGAWRTRIVLPADFERRYDVTERMLILAHEAMHARRHDGSWCLLAQIVVAVFWFHPLAWWALDALRHDQELACDAAVLREHGTQRRSYANAMLKTQSALFALPVGCPWSPRHPLTERIAMLKLPAPKRSRQFAGMISLSICMAGVAGLVYAATPEPAKVGVEKTAARSIYQLALTGRQGNQVLANPIVCMYVGTPAEVMQKEADGSAVWQFSFEVNPTDGNRVEVKVNGSMGTGVQKTPLNSILRGPLGKSMLVKLDDAEGKKEPFELEITPTLGCAAKPAADQSKEVSLHMKNTPARAAAESVASKAGYVLINPEVLDTRLITFEFDAMPVESAFELIAKIDGKKAQFDGKQVRFENK